MLKAGVFERLAAISLSAFDVQLGGSVSSTGSNLISLEPNIRNYFAFEYVKSSQARVIAFSKLVLILFNSTSLDRSALVLASRYSPAPDIASEPPSYTTQPRAAVSPASEEYHKTHFGDKEQGMRSSNHNFLVRLGFAHE